MLDKLHEIGIYYGDAYLNNFMVKDNNVYLIDFGKSKRIPVTDQLKLSEF